MAELNDLRLFYGSDRRVGSPAVARRLLAFKRVANETSRSALYVTGMTKAAAERLQTFAAQNGVTLWREPRLRRRPKVAVQVNATLITRFVKEFGLREGQVLSARGLTEGGAVLLDEALNEDGSRTMSLAASGASWSVRTRCPVEEASASLALEWHDDDRHDERDEIQSRISQLYTGTVASLSKAWGKPARIDSDGKTQWNFPRTTIHLRLELSDMFAALSVDVRARVKPAAKVRASRVSRRAKP